MTVTSPRLTAAGLLIKTQEEIISDMIAAIRAEVDPGLDLGTDDPIGQTVRIIGADIREGWEVLEGIVSESDPDASEGVYLDNIAAFSGTIRDPATFSTATVTIDVSAGFSIAAGALTIYVDGYPDRTFTNDSATSAVSDAVYDIQVTATQTGPVAAPSGTLTQIVGSVANLNSVTNASDAVLGTNVEEDDDLREKREDELRALGSGNPAAVRAKVIQVDNVLDCSVFENTSAVTNENGLPAHSMEVLVWDGSPSQASSNEIAQAIWDAKPGGIQFYGTGSNQGTAVDTDGVQHILQFSRATPYRTYIEITVDVDAAGWIGEAAAKDLIIARWNAKVTAESDVYPLDYSSVLQVLDSVVNVTSIKVDNVTPAVNTGKLTGIVRGIYTLDSGDITITAT